jgi:DNA polymerase III alpha subunit
MMVYPLVIDQVADEKKKNATGQMSLLDFMGEEEKEAFNIEYPDVPEFGKDILLNGEKEVLGFYVSGHPLDDVRDILEKETNITSADFTVDTADEEDGVSGETAARDGNTYTMGGIIEDVTAKITKNNENMAFLKMEDLSGTLEVVVFPRTYEKYRSLIEKGAKTVMVGHIAQPAYVKEIWTETNEVVLAPDSSLYSDTVVCGDVNFMSIAPLAVGEKIRCLAKIRYHHTPQSAELEMLAEDTVQIRFDAPVRAVTPGQSAVFYDEDNCVVGGGVIK